MHFREPLIIEKPKFLALTHVSVYGYWCCQNTILSAYNASVMFLLHPYQSIMSCHVMLCYNPSQSGLWIVWSKVFQERIHMYHFDLFPKQIYTEIKKKTENLLMLNSIIPKACKRWPRNGKSQVFKIRYYWLLISFDFWILRLSILKDLLATLQLQ